MSNNCLSVLYKHIIQVENKNGLKVGAQTYHCPPIKKVGGGGHMLPTPVIYIENTTRVPVGDDLSYNEWFLKRI